MAKLNRSGHVSMLLNELSYYAVDYIHESYEVPKTFEQTFLS